MFIILIFASLLLLFYLYYKKTANFWKERNVPFVKPWPIVGNFYNVLSMKKGLGFFLADMYNEMIDHPFFGIWVFHKPYLIVKSPDLIKCILATDFDVFSDRTVYANESEPFLFNMLFFQKNPFWKRARKQLSPAFTSGKLKTMMPLMNSCSRDMADFIQNEAKIVDTIDTKILFGKFMVSITASCVFGIEVKPFEEADHKFMKMSYEMFQGDLSNALRATSHFFIHSIAHYFKVKFVKQHILEFFTGVFTEAITQREYGNVKRNDFMEILIQLKQEEKKNGYGNEDIKAVAQALQFYLAGYETTSTTMAFTLYEMCINKNYQNKLRDDILSNILKHGGVTYEAIMDMKYLDNCISETLRKYPVLPFLDRLCGKDYKLPGTDVIIEKGTPVFIPLFGLHYDPKYFPNPEKYDPDRFTLENSKDRHSFCYLPFGEGPHNCIGARFGLLAAKLGIIDVISKFEVHRHKDTPVPVVFDPKSFIIQSIVGLPMSFTELNVANKD